ncbi:hypothetical protein [Candidatus Lokiarchaeum ossiferum]|uniref:hypothetical protein n=1 Tax=Candidatus Lokiarchaeum ossiferum TaxID=2951803 RepID=UPI00352CB3DA
MTRKTLKKLVPLIILFIVIYSINFGPIKEQRSRNNTSIEQPSPSEMVGTILNPQYFWIDHPFEISFRIGNEYLLNFTPYFAGETPLRWEIHHQLNGSRILNGTFSNATLISQNIAPNFTIDGFYYINLCFYTTNHLFNSSISVDVKERPSGQYFYTNPHEVENKILINQPSQMEWIPYFAGYSAQGWELFAGQMVEGNDPQHQLIYSGDYYDGVPFVLDIGNIFDTPGNYELILIFDTGEDQVFSYYFYYEVLAEEYSTYFEITHNSNIQFNLGQIQILEYTPHFSNYTPWRYEFSYIDTHSVLDMGSYVNAGFIQYNISQWFENPGNYTFKMTFLTKELRSFTANTTVEIFEQLEEDSTPPEWNDPINNITISVGTPININLNFSDSGGIASISTNDSSHISINETGFIRNSSTWNVGSFDINISIEDYSGNILIITISVFVLSTNVTETTSTSTTTNTETTEEPTNSTSSKSEANEFSSFSNIPGFQSQILGLSSLFILFRIYKKNKKDKLH